MANPKNMSVRFEVEEDGEAKSVEISNLSFLPSVGDEVECNYVHGTKVRFEVQGVKHFLFSSGHEIIQQVTVSGRAF